MRSTLTLQDVLELAVRVKQQESDMLNTIAVGKGPATRGLYIGNHIVQPAVLKLLQGGSGFLLQGQTQGAIRIMDLHDSRRPIANPRQIVFVQGVDDIAGKRIANSADDTGTYDNIAGEPQEIAAPGKDIIIPGLCTLYLRLFRSLFLRFPVLFHKVTFSNY